MKIRKAEIKDINRCIKLSHQEKEHYWSKKDFHDAVKNKDVEFYVAEHNEKIVGYSLGFIVPTKRDEALLHETKVDIKYRGKKIGTKLVNKICKKLFSRKLKTIYAMIEPELKPFYIKSCKFKETNKWIEVSKKK